MRELTKGLNFPEGPVACADGSLLVGEIASGTIARVALADERFGGRIQRVDVDTGTVEDLYTEFEGVPLVSPNDMVFDDRGCFYFTDTASGCLYYAAADGSTIVRVASD